PLQQMQMPQGDLLQAPPPLQQMGQQLPPMQQMALAPAADSPPGTAAALAHSPELRVILAAIGAGEPAWDDLIAYARREIVEAAYARADRQWIQRIRPAYLRALAASTESARRIAAQAPTSAAETVAALH